MITATGNRMPLLQTASHDTVSESVASLTFFSPSALSHATNFTSLSIHQILQFSCKGSVSYKLFLHVEFPLSREAVHLSAQYTSHTSTNATV